MISRQLQHIAHLIDRAQQSNVNLEDLIPIFAGAIYSTYCELLDNILTIEADWPWHEQQQQQLPTALISSNE